MFQLKNVLKRQALSGDGAYQFQTVLFRKDQQHAPRDIAMKCLADRDKQIPARPAKEVGSPRS